MDSLGVGVGHIEQGQALREGGKKGRKRDETLYKESKERARAKEGQRGGTVAQGPGAGPEGGREGREEGRRKGQGRRRERMDLLGC